MLLVSSLDVFDCCGLDLGGPCAHPDPDEEEDGRRDSGMISLSLVGRPASPPLPGSMRGPGHGGTFGLLLGTPTNPALVPSLYPESSGRNDRRQVQGWGHWLRPGVWGASGHCCALGSPSTCCTGILPPGALPEGFRSLGSLYLLSPASATPRRPLPGVLAKRRGRWWRKSSLTKLIVCGKGLLPWPLLCSLPGRSPGGPRSSDHWNH